MFERNMFAEPKSSLKNSTKNSYRNYAYIDFIIGDIEIRLYYKDQRIVEQFPARIKSFVVPKNNTPLSFVAYKWVKDEDFCLTKIYDESFSEKRREWLYWQDDTSYDERVYTFIKNSTWTVYYDKKNNRAIGVGPERFYLDMLMGALALGYLKASIQTSSFILHAAAIVISGRCFLFPAKSGCGKTTIALNAKKCGLAVLSDDRVVISNTAGAFMAHATPFGQLSDNAGPFPVSGIISLSKDRKNQISPFSRMKAFLNTWHEEIYYRNRYLYGNYGNKFFVQLSGLFDNTPCFLLRFNTNFQDWDIIKHSTINP